MIRSEKLYVALLFSAFLSALACNLQGQEYTGNENAGILSGDLLLLSPEEKFGMANKLYTENNFDEAVVLYEQIIDSGYRSAELFYNLGNAYYRSGNIAAAILNFERAALIAPGDEDIRFNLELARNRIRDRIEKLPVFFLNRWWQEARNLVDAGTWAAASVSFFIVTLVFLSVFLFSASVIMKKIFFLLAVMVFILSALSFSLGLDQRNYLRNHNTAIVFSPAVPVKSSPDYGSPDLFIIHEGTKVHVGESFGDWCSVRLSDGNQGWLPIDAIEMI